MLTVDAQATDLSLTDEELARLVELGEYGFAVRRDWPGFLAGHDFVHYRPYFVGPDFETFIIRDRRYWRRGPVRPTHSIVTIDPDEFDRHTRTTCTRESCPTALNPSVATRRRP